MRAVERAFRPRDIGADDRLTDILETDAVAGERAFPPRDIGPDDPLTDTLEPDAVAGEPRQIGLDAYRGADAALDRDAADAADFGQPLRHQCIGQVAEVAERNGR